MYESFFGLTGSPFRLIPDPSFLFTGKGHRDAFAALRVGLAAGARVTVLTGEPGAGKTTLLQALLASVDPAATVTAHVSAAHLDAETLSARLSEALGLPPQPQPLARRDALLTALPAESRTTFLVIDEAQHLAPSALDLLETLARATAAAPARLQICLVGQPELRILLNAAPRSGFRKLIGVDRHLGPLEQAEIRLYVEHRLHRAGWTGRPEFEDAAFSEIFIFTTGNPRRINLLCNSLMLCACLKKQQRIDAPAVTWAAAAMREDSFQGAPDLLDLGSHFEHRPTLTEAFEPDTPDPEAAPRREDNPPSLDVTGESQGETICASEATVTTPSDPVQANAATSAPAADEPTSPTKSGATSYAVETARSDAFAEMTRRQVSATRRRRQAILLVAASVVVVALALLAYVVDQPSLPTGLSQNQLRDIVANRTASPTPSPALEPQRRAVGSVAPAASTQAPAPVPVPDLAGRARVPDPPAAKAPLDSDNSRGRMAGEIPGVSGAVPEYVPPVNPARASSPTPSCSGPAFALGLCDADSSPTRRQ